MPGGRDRSRREGEKAVTRTPLRLAGLLAAVVAGALGASPVTAALLQFEFTTTVDATDFGLSSAEPLVIRYRYDPATLPLVIEFGPPASRRIYGPVYGVALIGGDVVSIEGQLGVDDDNYGHDAYDFYAASYVADTSVTGSVNGISISYFDLYLLDQTAPTSMLASLDPPSATAFASEASLVRVDLHDYFNSYVATRDFAPAEHGLFSFTVPEPAAASTALAALGALAGVASRARGRRGGALRRA